MARHADWRSFLSVAACGLAALVLLASCGSPSSSSNKKQPAGTEAPETIAVPTVSMDFPDSLTGGTGVVATATGGRHAFMDSGMSCGYMGNGTDDPFQNGYRMSKYLIAIIATWQCVSDQIIGQVAQLGNLATGQMIPIGDNMDPSAPTGLSITLDSATQTTLRMYYHGNTTTPGLFISWNTVGRATAGKLIFGQSAMQGDMQGPAQMRMDFTVTDAARVGDMYVYFATNPVIDGFRIQVTEDLVNDEPRFTALGLLDVATQWDADYRVNGPSDGVNPTLAMYAIANAAGQGAADAIFSNVGWGVNFNLLMSGGDGHFGFYRFDKDDRYFFLSTGGSQWVDKTISSATWVSGVRNNTNPTTANIRTFLGLTSVDLNYFNSTPYCSAIGESCVEFVQAVHSGAGGGWAGQEPNGGADPGDWRSPIMAGVGSGSLLTTTLPPGAASWSDAFQMTFTP